MRLNRNGKLTLLGLGLAALLATAVAAVPGIFTTVNVTTGYQVNGAAGTSGYSLCSDGTYYDLSCAPFALPNVGTPGTYSNPASITTDAQGRVTAITAGAGREIQPALATCTPATSTDADCTGTITLSSAWPDTNYAIAASPLSSAGAHLSFVPMVKANGSFTYNLSCAFNCSSYGTVSVDVTTLHN